MAEIFTSKERLKNFFENTFIQIYKVCLQHLLTKPCIEVLYQQGIISFIEFAIVVTQNAYKVIRESRVPRWVLEALSSSYFHFMMLRILSVCNIIVCYTMRGRGSSLYWIHYTSLECSTMIPKVMLEIYFQIRSFYYLITIRLLLEPIWFWLFWIEFLNFLLNRFNAMLQFLAPWPWPTVRPGGCVPFKEEKATFRTGPHLHLAL